MARRHGSRRCGTIGRALPWSWTAVMSPSIGGMPPTPAAAKRPPERVPWIHQVLGWLLNDQLEALLHNLEGQARDLPAPRQAVLTPVSAYRRQTVRSGITNALSPWGGRLAPASWKGPAARSSTIALHKLACGGRSLAPRPYSTGLPWLSMTMGMIVNACAVDRRLWNAMISLTRMFCRTLSLWRPLLNRDPISPRCLAYWTLSI